MIACFQFMPVSFSPERCANNTLASVDSAIAPANPSQVFPGLMRGIILCRPMSEPTTYAPVSLNLVTRMK